MKAMSLLKRQADKFIARYGARFYLTTTGAAATIRGRLMDMSSVPRLVSSGTSPFITAANLFEFFTSTSAGVVSGALLAEYDASREYLLYVDFAHRIGDDETHVKVFALRVNISSLSVRRRSDIAGPAGGVTNALVVAPVASGVKGHYYESKNSIDAGKDGRTEDFDGVLVVKQGLGIAVHDLVQVGSKWFEFAGVDVDALPGLDAWRLALDK